MKYIIFFIAITLVLIPAARPQSTLQPLSGDVQKDLPLLLKPGIHVADVLGRQQPTAREYQLLGKVMMAIQTNRVWFTDTLPALPPGQFAAGLKKLGLTPAEYDEYNELSESRDSAVVVGRDTLEIIRKGNIISFKGRNRLKSLDSVKIDLVSKLVLYGRKRDSLAYSGTTTNNSSNNNDHKNIYPIPPASYKFSLTRQTSDANALTAGNWQNLNVKDMGLTVGRVEDTHKTMLLLMASKIVKGKSELAVVVPIVFE